MFILSFHFLMKKMKKICLCNDEDKGILYPVEADYIDQEGVSRMKKHNGFEVTHKDSFVFQYMDGVPAAEKKQYWLQSPWGAFRWLLHS